MMSTLEQWSAAHLGQWHYLLGYSIVLLGHNWPLLLSAGLCLGLGTALYRRPSRRLVCWFLAALLLGVGFEYQKHAAPTLRASLDTVLHRELAWLNGPAQALLGPGVTTLLFGGMLLLLGQGLRLALGARGATALPATEVRR